MICERIFREILENIEKIYGMCVLAKRSVSGISMKQERERGRGGKRS